MDLDVYILKLGIYILYSQDSISKTREIGTDFIVNTSSKHISLCLYMVSTAEAFLLKYMCSLLQEVVGANQPWFSILVKHRVEYRMTERQSERFSSMNYQYYRQKIGSEKYSHHQCTVPREHIPSNRANSRVRKHSIILNVRASLGLGTNNDHFACVCRLHQALVSQN